MNHLNNIVKKPWGYEYLVYENSQVALWFLYINHNHKTSMHCHPNKTTGLALLDGKVEVSFLKDKYSLMGHDKLMIRKGLFHSTEAIGPRGAWVFEIETPVNKNDLVRLRDSYGREGKPYENATFEYPKRDDCLWIEDPLFEKSNVYYFANSILTVSRINDISFFKNINDQKNIIFLKGGIITEYNINVAGAGDIVSAQIIKELAKVFTKLDSETVVMEIEEIQSD